ncbi:MAG TPA: RNB domain-containing ribonuclease, partial [Nannocystaceae bacterium]|nr:RNB domain-containing ribonuclease [Nannocystaceae bacterium]
MASPSPLPRWSLAGLALLHGAVLAAAASVLPWRPGTPFAALTTVLALAHFVTAALAVVGSPRRALAWRITSLAALLFLAYHTWLLVDAATYIAVLYGGLGEGVAAGVAAAWAVIVLFTVPLAAWGIAATGGIRRYRFYPAVMHSHARLTYTQVWAWLSDPSTATDARAKALLPHLRTLHELYRVLATGRVKRGAIDFETGAPELVFDA